MSEPMEDLLTWARGLPDHECYFGPDPAAARYLRCTLARMAGRPRRTRKMTQEIEDRILALRHSGASVTRVAEQMGMTVPSVVRAYARGAARNMPPGILREESARALMVCDEQILRCRQRLSRPHPVRDAKGTALLDAEGQMIPDLDVENRIEAEITKIEERRARIAGTLAPAKHAIAVLQAEDLQPLLAEWRGRLTPSEIQEAKRRAESIPVASIAKSEAASLS